MQGVTRGMKPLLLREFSRVSVTFLVSGRGFVIGVWLKCGTK